MTYPEDTNPKDTADETEEQHLILDGTVNLDYPEDSQVPRVKGLIELLNHYFAHRQNH